MRGRSDEQGQLWLMINLEEKVPVDHPLRAIKARCQRIFREMRADFAAAYGKTGLSACNAQAGRPSVPPEQILKALLLQALYSIPSEIKLMQAIDFNLLYRWFLDLGDRPAWTPEVFSMNRRRFADHGLTRKFFDRVVAAALTEQLASEDHFTVDGTLIRSWASLKSLVPLRGNGERRVEDDDPGNPTVNFHGERRRNETHLSRTDPEARLARKGAGKEAHLCHSGHVLMENRHGLCLAVRLDAADGHAERRAARAMLTHVRRRHRLFPATVGFDAGYDDGAFLHALEDEEAIVAHVPVRRGKLAATDVKGTARRRARRRMHSKAYAISQRRRKRVEEIFGWMKTVGGLARARASSGAGN